MLFLFLLGTVDFTRASRTVELLQDVIHGGFSTSNCQPVQEGTSKLQRSNNLSMKHVSSVQNPSVLGLCSSPTYIYILGNIIPELIINQQGCSSHCSCDVFFPANHLFLKFNVSIFVLIFIMGGIT